MRTFESKGVKLDVARFVDDSLRRGDSDIYQKVIAAVDDVVLERILRQPARRSVDSESESHAIERRKTFRGSLRFSHTGGHAAAPYGLVQAVLPASTEHVQTDNWGSPGTCEILSSPQ